MASSDESTKRTLDDLNGYEAFQYAAYMIYAMRFLFGEVACVLEFCGHGAEGTVCRACTREAATMLWTLGRCEHGREFGPGPGACQPCVRRGEGAMRMISAYEETGVLSPLEEDPGAVPLMPHVAGWRRRKDESN